MTLSVRSVAITAAVLWGGGVLFVALVNLVLPSYGSAFLHGVSSCYPGFHDSRHIIDVLIGTGYAVLDGAAGGALFAWLYNLLNGRSHSV